MAVGVLLLGVAAFQAAFPETSQSLMALANQMIFSAVCDLPAAECRLGTTGFVVPGAVMVGAMMLAWAVTIGCAVIVQIAVWAKGRFPERGNVQPIVQQAIALMTILWIVMMMAVWAAIMLIHETVAKVTAFHLPKGLSVDLVYGSLRFATPAILALIGLGLVALALHLRKARAFARLFARQLFAQAG